MTEPQPSSATSVARPPVACLSKNYWQVENMGAVSAKIDEQKTEGTKQKVIELVKAL